MRRRSRRGAESLLRVGLCRAGGQQVECSSVQAWAGEDDAHAHTDFCGESRHACAIERSEWQGVGGMREGEGRKVCRPAYLPVRVCTTIVGGRHSVKAVQIVLGKSHRGRGRRNFRVWRGGAVDVVSCRVWCPFTCSVGMIETRHE